ncbi:MAG: DUF6122 family protein [Desulfosalsimonadaceae bacterium]
MLRPALHLLLHFIVPALVARWGYKDRWKPVWAVMMLTMIVDLDHLLATPVFAPDRCSIGFHPLHTWPAILFYGGLTAFPSFRTISIGLIIHMALDALDCAWMRY